MSKKDVRRNYRPRLACLLGERRASWIAQCKETCLRNLQRCLKRSCQALTHSWPLDGAELQSEALAQSAQPFQCLRIQSSWEVPPACVNVNQNRLSAPSAIKMNAYGTLLAVSVQESQAVSVDDASCKSGGCMCTEELYVSLHIEALPCLIQHLGSMSSSGLQVQGRGRHS